MKNVTTNKILQELADKRCTKKKLLELKSIVNKMTNSEKDYFLFAIKKFKSCDFDFITKLVDFVKQNDWRTLKINKSVFRKVEFVNMKKHLVEVMFKEIKKNGVTYIYFEAETTMKNYWKNKVDVTEVYFYDKKNDDFYYQGRYGFDDYLYASIKHNSFEKIFEEFREEYSSKAA